MIGLNTAQIIGRARDKGINLSEAQAQDILSQAFDPSQYGADEGRVNALLSGGGFSGGSGDPAGDFIKSVLDDLTKPLREALDRAKQFDDKNPFAFDEELARASAEERFDPYYEAELRDFLTGINKTRSRTKEDEEALRTELDITTEQTGGKLRKNLEETIKTSEEGYAGAGLLFSGARERTTGIQETEGTQDIENLDRQSAIQKNQSLTRESRTLEDLAGTEATGLRESGAARETALTTDVEGQRKESLQKRELERQNFIGFPLGGGSSSISSIFGIG